MSRIATRTVLVWMLAGCGSDPAVESADASPDDPNGPDAAIGPATPDAAPAPGDPDAAPATFACAPERVSGHQEIACPEGVVAEVEVSAACVAGGCGVILDVHGYTMSADQMDEHTRMRALAPPLGYVVVQPTGPGALPGWGSGEQDDVVWEFLEATIATFDIDETRIHVTGFSQGGMMSFRQLCAHADRFASVAPAAGGGCFDGATPAVEVPILYLHGHDDLIVSWDLVAEPQRDAILATWDFGPPTVLSQASGYTATRWTTSAGTVFELWEHDYNGNILAAGHCMPGPDDGAEFRCDGSEFDFSMEVLRFFQEHRKGDGL